MKISRLAIIGLVNVAIARQAVFNTNDWSRDDLVDFLQDQKENIKVTSSETLDQLKNSAKEIWEENQKPSSSFWNFWSSKKDDSSWIPDNAKPISNWLFETWSDSQLRSLLEKNNIPSTAEETKDELVAKMKSNYNKIAKNYKSSGLYPSNKFFENWSTDDIKVWLDEFKVKYDKSISDRDKLLREVKKNIYKISNRVDDERYKVLSSLDLANKKLYDKSGKLKKDIFKTWSNMDIEKWLSSHNVDINEKLADSHDYLVDTAEKNRKALENDVQWYLDASKEKISPFLSKGPEYVKDFFSKSVKAASNLVDKSALITGEKIDDTFLVGIDQWPKKKLKDYLDSRNVDYPYFATRKELKELVFQYRYKPVLELKESLMPRQMMNDLKNWSLQKRDDVKSTEADIRDSFVKKFESWEQEASKLKDDASSSLTNSFNSWSTDDLVSYVKGFGLDFEPTAKKDELVKIAKDNTLWFFGRQQQPFYKRYPENVKNLVKRGFSMIYS